MPWAQPKQASSATMSIVYITVGALIDVWSVIYYIYLNRHVPASDNAFLWVYGFFFSGIVLMAIGFTLGWIGRAAKQAEVAAPPQVVSMTAPPAAGAAPSVVMAVPTMPAPTMPASPASPVATRIPTGR